MCSRENSIDIIKDSILPYDTSESFKTIVAFDCRGIEPVDFSPRVGFKASGEATFEDVSLTELVSQEKICYKLNINYYLFYRSGPIMMRKLMYLLVF